MTEPALTIICEVAADYGLTPRDLLGDDKSRRIALPRFEAWRRLHEELHVTQSDIARLFGRDPSSIRYGIRRARQERQG